MKIGLHDLDNTGFPNLALMKLSAWHKAKGDDVSWFHPLYSKYDEIYSSKVFTFSKTDPYLPKNAKLGGTGYGSPVVLPQEIEHICPDYDLYGIDYSMGFLTRGCIRKCEWCVVPDKEGSIVAHADIEEFARHKEVVLMDNNVLAHPHGILQIEKIIRLGLRVDFNQGLDSRLIDAGIAKLLSKVKWLNPLRLACDSKAHLKEIDRVVDLLRWYNATPSRYFCYVLVKDISDALERVRFLKKLHIDPFAQPYIDPEGTPPSEEQRHFARWVNHKAEFKSRTWEEYRMFYMKRKLEELE